MEECRAVSVIYVHVRTNSGSFDCVSRDETARDFAQDENYIINK